MKKQKGNSLGNITWSEMGKQNVQGNEVNYTDLKITDDPSKSDWPSAMQFVEVIT